MRGFVFFECLITLALKFSLVTVQIKNAQSFLVCGVAILKAIRGFAVSFSFVSCRGYKWGINGVFTSIRL
ncbi:hypothetical protein [Campylobacter troglodytis]|uniref:hypothetical protein n=1 Tax=Campylobacter troglodytis TaxID=654363 RepID=UPI0011576C4A|nr:hypothetical protein [Campylobacter troglodytis]TQR54793.1 hypothetical protein DMC01_09895 [Campylobacter troglodytis]